ncbi:integrase family protein [Sphingomonas sp. MG17]|uniref:Integrase family protein n=1 Tax=Sphingomonas tagetis TaxID=2949092 RepID=A0A9X2HHG3_9SPHN|nr:integrase family protein [Sphingomonas tagetis]MCP3731281.1 integrase family protein [Sphingomonas tagetis]
MAQRVNLTPTNIDNLRIGSLSDPRTPGLYIEIQTGRGRLLRIWKYRRRIAGGKTSHKATLGPFPAHTIADARDWANKLNLSIEKGIDPIATKREHLAASIPVSDAHALYMDEINAGTRRKLKPRTIADKEKIWASDLKAAIGHRILQEITEDDLWSIVLAKGRKAPIRANRLAAELKVFMKWCASRAGREAGVRLKASPAATLDAYYFPSRPRARFLSHEELSWFLQALAVEERVYQRALLLLLLTGCRKEEVLAAPASEFVADVWSIPSERTKNWQVHRIPLSPWACSLSRTNSEWLIPSERVDGPMIWGWYKILSRIRVRMGELGGRAVEHFTLHDLRRTMRSNTKRLKIDLETAEAMLNHKKKGLEEIYDGYDLFDEKREGFAKWESFLVSLAVTSRVEVELSIPDESIQSCGVQPDHQANLQLQLF